MVQLSFVLECSSQLGAEALGLQPLLGPGTEGGTVLDAALSLILRAYPSSMSSIFVVVTDRSFARGFIAWALARGVPFANVQQGIFTPPPAAPDSSVVFMRDNLVLPSNFDFAQFLSATGPHVPPIVLLDQELARRRHTGHHIIVSQADYVAACDSRRALVQRTLLASLPSTAQESCHARIGLMGNPSDGFHGKTLSFLIRNFSATVTVTATDDGRVEVLPNPEADTLSFARGGLGALGAHTAVNGYYGGVRLVQAACHVFFQKCTQRGLLVQHCRGLSVAYETTIPRMVGLSGSSAIIVATFRALVRFFGVDVQRDLGIAPDELPTVILDVEREQLGISAGLQDRVVQTYGGLVHMDFSPPLVPRASALVGGVYTKVDPALLPPMYLAYNTLVGGDSGKVHSTVKERWAQREPGLVAGMQELAGLADEALVALRGTDAKRLASLMTKNFGCRRRLYGDDVVGMKNIAVIDLLFSLGLSAKFTGSGGAIVCMRSDGLGWLEADHEDKVVAAVLEHGFELIRVVPAGP
jgi:glucuronokinase